MTETRSPNCIYFIALVVDYTGLSTKYQYYVSKFLAEVEPANYEEAANDKRWVQAMKTEIQALEDNKTWELVPLPKGKKHIG